MKKILIASTLLTAAMTSSLAQHHGHQHSLYAGLKNREIKALSEQQIDALLAGKGVGMAMPGELNGYPGPLHVLELATKIGLTAKQEALTKKLYTEMLEAAKAQGEKVIEGERELNELFAQKKATSESVSFAVNRVASAQGKLREMHLFYHLLMMDVLTPEQVAAYNQLRGY